MRQLLSIGAAMALCFSLCAQSEDPCDENGSDDPNDYACVGELFGHPYNVDDIGCAGNCDSRGVPTGIPGVPAHPFWSNVHLGAKCVALGMTPSWILANEELDEFTQGADIPDGTVVFVSLDSALLVPPISVTFPNQEPQCFCTCKFYLPFASWEVWSLPSGLASTPWGNTPTKVYDAWDFTIPNNPALLGLEILSQAYLYRPAQSGSPRIDFLSNAIKSTIVAGS